jgi:SAM-dependent methyltransferase
MMAANDNGCVVADGTPVENLPGHVFLAKMGKKLLRPGGRRATEELFSLADLHPGERVCEIATNRAVSAIEMSERFGVEVDGVDVSPEFLSVAARNVTAHGLQDRIRLHVGTGHELPFKDSSFDAVIAEAVITMLPPARKAETVEEAARVLRPGGRLVIHELAWAADAEASVHQELVRTIRHGACPLTVDQWRLLLTQAGLGCVVARVGPMSLMSPRGLLRDEGVGGVARMMWNVVRTPGGLARWKKMAAFFHRNHHRLRYIVLRADR